jgi:hypothetical protein
MCICGLSGSERQLFMSVLMHFGPPFIHRQPDLGWAPYHQHLAGKTRSQVCSSCMVSQLFRPCTERRWLRRSGEQRNRE